jgi:hypothetical protein
MWGSPFGATVGGYDELHAIHVRLKKIRRGGTWWLAAGQNTPVLPPPG